MSGTVCGKWGSKVLSLYFKTHLVLSNTKDNDNFETTANATVQKNGQTSKRYMPPKTNKNEHKVSMQQFLLQSSFLLYFWD
jgi:hypothetical protein